MTPFWFRLIFVCLYAQIAAGYHSYSTDATTVITMIIGCVAAYVIAVNLPPFLASIEERAQTMGF